ncbi:MAG: amidohydrolase/deacetylase family metallohydrolase [Acidobacteria bacterium]|nr:MAG: amidohydrolase/deacetylase family metallohydrolase [Acidobacteriota bacterium]
MSFQSSNSLTRRELLAGMGASMALGGAGRKAGSNPVKSSGKQDPAAGKPYDLVIRGGRVIDPSQDLDAVRDVAITGGKIARVKSDIPSSQAREVINASGKIVTPGLIDIHTHVFPYVGPYGIEPDPYCVHRGVTTVVDAGTSGSLAFPAFRKFIIERAATRIRPLLHVVSIGMIAGSTPNMGELEDLRYCVPKLAVQAANRNRDLVVGFKIRFSRDYTGPNDYEGMKRARETADEARLPLMIHIGGSYTPLPKLLALMKKGDVVTHAFNGHPDGIVDSRGKLLPEVLEARRRGVLFDVGHGAGSFSFDVMEECLKQDFLPDTISSDLYSANINGPVFDLVTTLSKFLLLGLSLRQVVERVTVNSARVFDFGAEIGTLRPGAEADVSVLDLREGNFVFVDSGRKTRTGRQKIEPVVTIRGGKAFYPAA